MNENKLDERMKDRFVGTTQFIITMPMLWG